MSNKTSKIFQVPAVLEGTNPLKDGGMSLRFHTQELSSEEKLEIIKLFQTFGFILFRANRFTDSDVPKDDASDRQKTPSQRFRAVVFVMWKQKGSEGDFEQFYNRKMEYIISEYKKRLEPNM